MAMVDVELDEQLKGDFFNFRAIGDKLTGVFMRTAPSGGEYGGTNYQFNTPDGLRVITARSQLAQKLAKANLQPGHKVLVEYTGDRDVGKPSPMKEFRVAYDPVITESTRRYAKGEPIPRAGGQAKPPPPVEPEADEPF